MKIVVKNVNKVIRMEIELEFYEIDVTMNDSNTETEHGYKLFVD